MAEAQVLVRWLQQFEGVIWRFKTGGQWREMPQEFGAWSTVHNRFRQWRDAGVFEALLEGLIAEAAKRGEVDLACLPASGASEESGLQPEGTPTPDTSSLLPFGTGLGVLPVLFFEAAPFDLVFPSSAAAFSRAVMTSSSRCIPAASR